jgi:hypothetical protein
VTPAYLQGLHSTRQFLSDLAVWLDLCHSSATHSNANSEAAAQPFCSTGTQEQASTTGAALAAALLRFSVRNALHDMAALITGIMATPAGAAACGRATGHQVFEVAELNLLSRLARKSGSTSMQRAVASWATLTVGTESISTASSSRSSTSDACPTPNSTQASLQDMKSSASADNSAALRSTCQGSAPAVAAGPKQGSVEGKSMAATDSGRPQHATIRDVVLGFSDAGLERAYVLHISAQLRAVMCMWALGCMGFAVCMAGRDPTPRFLLYLCFPALGSFVPVPFSLKARSSQATLLWLGPVSCVIRFAWLLFIAAGCLRLWTPDPQLLLSLARSFNARTEIAGSLLQAYSTPVGAVLSSVGLCS